MAPEGGFFYAEFYSRVDDTIVEVFLEMDYTMENHDTEMLIEPWLFDERGIESPLYWSDVESDDDDFIYYAPTIR